MRHKTIDPVDHRQAARRTLLRRLLLSQATILQHLGPNANRRLRTSVHRRIAADLTDVFIALASERLGRDRPMPFKTIAAARRALDRAGVPDDCDLARQAADAVRIAGRAADAEGSGWVIEATSRRLVVEAAVVHASIITGVAEAWNERNSKLIAIGRHATFVQVREALDPEPIEPLPIPPLPSRPANGARA